MAGQSTLSSRSYGVAVGSGNFAGVVSLAVCALGLAFALYVANQKRGSAKDSHKLDFGRSTSSGVNRGTPQRPATGGASSTSACPDTRNGPECGARMGGNNVGGDRKTYYSVRGELHVKQHNANLVEWVEESLGIRIPFSPILFAMQQEVRQAPLILLTLRYLRQEGHHIAIAIEETRTEETPEVYRDNSLSKIAACSKILSSSTTRIGNKQLPQAEYCYVDDQVRLTYVLSIFMTHKRLALTVQYMADTRVSTILPTAFNALVRGIQFSLPRPSPSYLLFSEPRLGIAFRLPLDFTMCEAFLDGASDAIPENLSPRRWANGGEMSLPKSPTRTPAWETHGYLGSEHGPHTAAVFAAPYVTAVGRGARRMAIVASYEPAPGSSCLVHAGGRGDFVGAAWQQYVEHRVPLALQLFGMSPPAPLHLIFREEMKPPKVGTEVEGCFVIRPCHLSVSTKGNFTVAEEEDSLMSSAVLLKGSFFMQEIRIQSDSAVSTYLMAPRETFDDTAVAGGHAARPSPHSIYIGGYYFLVGDECVSFYFLSVTRGLSFADFVAFCMRTMGTVSLGNHYGQTPSVLYCNIRHELPPFSLTLDSPHEVVEEPQLGDPLAVVHACGSEQVSVLIRVLPALRGPAVKSGMCLPSLAVGTPSTVQTPPTRQLRRHTVLRLLGGVLQQYLSQLPGSVHILYKEELAVQSAVALEVCFELMAYVEPKLPGDHGSPINGDATNFAHPPNTLGAEKLQVSYSSQCDDADGCSVGSSEWVSAAGVVLDDEVGTVNPLARYFPPPPAPMSYTYAGSDMILLATDDEQSASGMLHYTAPSASQISEEEVEYPLRVVVALYREGHTFLFMTSASEYTLGMAQRTIRQLPSRLSIMHSPL